jgi:hypothetical protein
MNKTHNLQNARAQTFQGRGGHMNAALIHEVQFVNRQIRFAYAEMARYPKSSKYWKDAQARANRLVRHQGRKIRVVTDRLRERGHFVSRNYLLSL